jgi:hypothetical protein
MIGNCLAEFSSEKCDFCKGPLTRNGEMFTLLRSTKDGHGTAFFCSVLCLEVAVGLLFEGRVAFHAPVAK